MEETENFTAEGSWRSSGGLFDVDMTCSPYLLSSSLVDSRMDETAMLRSPVSSLRGDSRVNADTLAPRRFIEAEREAALLGEEGGDKARTVRHVEDTIMGFGGGPRECPGKVRDSRLPQIPSERGGISFLRVPRRLSG